jgi:endonuclease/exonuclease/phosphatase family metal-dependent hydrolase
MLYILHLLSILCVLAMRSTAQLPIRLLTHNIRYATSSPFTGEKPWADRRQLLLNELYYHTLYNQESFVCLQEVLHNQLIDVMTGLNSTSPSPAGNAEAEWAYIGVGRDDGQQAGEYSPIIYRPSIWKLESWKTVWLSETPDVPGKGWDAASVRIVTVGSFVHRQSKARVVGLCTHFDDQGVVSRRESAKLILKVVEDVTSPNTNTTNGNATGAAAGERIPVFLGGDLNSETSGDAYQILNGKESSLRDVKELSGWRYGDKNTFTGFTGSTRKTEIDHVFVGPRGGTNWSVRGYSVLPNRFEDGVYNSDHEAVVGDVVLVG